MIIYVDILIILNTMINYFILLAIRKITRSYTKRWRIAVGAVSGGISSMLIFLENLGLITTLLKLLTSVLMIIITFGISSKKKFFTKLFFLFAITFLFGGVAFAFYIFSDKNVLVYSNGIIYFDVDMTFLIICSVISYFVISLISKITDKKAPKQKEYFVTVENNGVSITVTALMDTGNNLRDPFSGYPVLLADSEIFNKLYCEDKLRLIPLSTVGGDSIIKAFRPYKLTVNGFSTDKIYIGESLSPLDEYKIILNINLEGEIADEQNYVIG